MLLDWNKPFRSRASNHLLRYLVLAVKDQQPVIREWVGPRQSHEWSRFGKRKQLLYDLAGQLKWLIWHFSFSILFFTNLHAALFPHCFWESTGWDRTLRLFRSIPHWLAFLRNTPPTISDLSERQTIPLRLSEARRERSLRWHLDAGLCRRRSLLPVTAHGQGCERNISQCFWIRNESTWDSFLKPSGFTSSLHLCRKKPTRSGNTCNMSGKTI